MFKRYLDVTDFIDLFWAYNLAGHLSFCLVFFSSFTVRDLSVNLVILYLCDVHYFRFVILFYL